MLRQRHDFYFYLEQNWLKTCCPPNFPSESVAKSNLPDPPTAEIAATFPMMPAVRGDAMRGLAVFISDIRNCKSKEAEVKRINKELANIRSVDALFGDTESYRVKLGKILFGLLAKRKIWKLAKNIEMDSWQNIIANRNLSKTRDMDTWNWQNFTRGKDVIWRIGPLQQR